MPSSAPHLRHNSHLKMKIALVTEVSPLYVNGVSRTIVRLLDHLTEQGHEVVVFGPDSGHYKNVRLVGTFGVPLFFYPELKFNFATPSMVYQLRQYQPEIIHFVDPNLLGPQMLVWCKMFLPHVPRIASYHTNIALYATMFGFSYLYEPIWWTMRMYHGACRKTLCPSHSTKAALVANGIPAEKVGIWTRGVEMAMFNPERRNMQLREKWLCAGKPTLQSNSSTSSLLRRASNEDEGVSFGLQDPEDKLIILYVGRISWEKNIQVLVEAYKGMNHEQVHLVIVGDGPAKASIQGQLRSADVTFTGYLRGEELAEAYASADIFAFPSKSETFGQVVLEAQASALPCVIMDAEGVSEIVEGEVSGIITPLPANMDQADSVEVQEAFRANIERLVDNPVLREKMSRNAVARAQKFSWYEAMQACVDAYADTIVDAQMETNTSIV